MTRHAGLVLLSITVWSTGAGAQPDTPALTGKALEGRNLFTQHCVVCHINTQITAGGHYGPSLSKASLGGQAAVMRAVIGEGTPNMPGFKYTFRPDEIDAIVAYLQTLPVPPPAAPATSTQH